MNIITIPYGGELHYIRPDISYNKDSNDYFCPDYIEELAAVPFVYVRIDKAAKAVQARFAPRYYTAAGYGIRLIATSLLKQNNPVSWWLANCPDLCTYMSKAVDLSRLNEVTGAVKVYAGQNEYLAGPYTFLEKINRSIAAVSAYSSLKTGDFITLDLLPENAMPLQKERDTDISLGEIRFKIIW